MVGKVNGSIRCLPAFLARTTPPSRTSRPGGEDVAVPDARRLSRTADVHRVPECGPIGFAGLAVR
jgi:hypothetical protein